MSLSTYTTEALLVTLLERGVITNTQFISIDKKSRRLRKKALMNARQNEVNSIVQSHIESLEAGALFKHRSVWEAVGREDFARAEVLKALQSLKLGGLVDQVKKGNNNFQIFWTRTEAETNEEE